MKNWILYGGGLDSTALAVSIDKPFSLMHIDYGQKAADKEYESAESLVARYPLMILHTLNADLSFSNSAIMSGGIATDRHANRLELRNPFLFMLAASYIASTDFDNQHQILLGFHKEHDRVFPDACEDWIAHMNDMLSLATDCNIKVTAPFAKIERLDIAKIGYRYDPEFFDIAYTCYEAEECGRCKHCLEKRAMLKLIEGEQQ